MSTIILGGMEYGRRLSYNDALRATETFFNHGYKEVDTAYVYNNGASEELIATMNSPSNNRLFDKNDALIATKVVPIGPGGLSASGMQLQFTTSLKRLSKQQVDIFYLHWPDETVPIEESLAVMNRFYKEKKFLRFGLSNYPAWQVAQIYSICKDKGYPLPTVYQGMYNGLTRDCEKELIPCLRTYNIKFYAFNILAAGILTGKHKYNDINDADNSIQKGRFHGKNNKLGEMYRNRFWKKSYFDGLSLIQNAINVYNNNDNNDNNNNSSSDGERLTIVEASMRWMQHHSVLRKEDGIILGASSMKHFNENLAALENTKALPDNVVEAFDRAWEICKKDVPRYFRGDYSKLRAKL